MCFMLKKKVNMQIKLCIYAKYNMKQKSNNIDLGKLTLKEKRLKHFKIKKVLYASK